MNGYQHEMVTMGTSIVAISTSLMVGEIMGLWVSGGCLLGIFLSPDLDVDGWTVPKRRLRQIPVFGFFLRWYWQPYSLAIKHRSRLSHFPVIGTLGRVGYGLWWVIVIAARHEMWIELNLFVLGLIIVDTLHYLCDVVSTAWRSR